MKGRNGKGISKADVICESHGYQCGAWHASRDVRKTARQRHGAFRSSLSRRCIIKREPSK